MQRYYSALVFTALLLLLACDNDSLTDAFNTNGDFTQSNIAVTQIDTFSVNMSTYRYDSINSNAAGRLLVGRYTDPHFGVVKASAYASFVPQAYYIDQEAVLDSVVVSLAYDKFYYNDTLAPKTIIVNELTKEIRYRNGQTDFYNTSNVTASDAIIGQKTFYPRISNDSLTIRLNYAFGLNLFKKIQDNVINDQEQFTDYFKGLKFSPADTEDAAVVGFNVGTSYIRFYYSLPDQASTESAYIDFLYNSTSDKKYFNKVEGDRTGTLLEHLNGQENEAPSASLNNLAFIQAGIGITTKFTFPSIRDISTINNNNGAIYKANLKIRLNSVNYSKNLYPSDSLYVYVVDQNNDFLSQLTDAAGNAIYAKVDRSDQETNEVYLTAPVETYLEKVLSNNQYLNYGMIFIPKNVASTTERLILNGEHNSNYKTRLELTYISYDK